MFNKIRNFFQKKPRTRSEAIKQFAKRNNLPVIDMPLSRIEPCDMKGLPILPVHPADREVKVGDTALMEYAVGVVETVIVTEIVDGIVYGEGDDGEPYCAPVDNCDKVPF